MRRTGEPRHPSARLAPGINGERDYLMSLLIKTSEDQSFEIKVQDSYFEVSPITASEAAKIQKQHGKYENGRLTSEGEKRIISEKFKKTVKNWRNVKDVTGKDVPYSDELRDKFAELNQGWASLIVFKAEQNQAEVREEEENNLGE